MLHCGGFQAACGHGQRILSVRDGGQRLGCHGGIFQHLLNPRTRNNMAPDKRVIYTAAHAQQAHLLRQHLEEHGIVAEVWNEALQGALGELPLVDSVAPVVVVPSSVAKVAREVAVQWEADMDNVLETKADTKRVVDAWPHCPKCQMPRNAECPFCHVAGTEYGDAYLPEDYPADQQASLTEQLRVCLVCDEPTVPKFYRLCVQCGHDFGSGVQVKLAAPPEEIPPRTMFVLFGLAAVATIVFGYFWYVTR